MRALRHWISSISLASSLFINACAHEPHSTTMPQDPLTKPPFSEPLASDPIKSESEPKNDASPSPVLPIPKTHNDIPDLYVTHGDTTKLRRKALVQLLDLGPHYILQRTHVEAEHRRGRFWGWRIVAYQGPGHLEPGDIVRSVNGQSLETPDHLMRVWEALRTAKQFDLVIVRKEQPMRILLRIVE